MELRYYLSILRKWVWLLVLAPLVAGSTTFFVSLRTEPVYQASATLLVSQVSGSSSLDYSSLLTSERVAKTYAELLTKRPLMEKVISDLQLDLTPYQLAGQISIVQPQDTQLLELRVEDSNPQLAIAIANSIAASFLERNNQRRSSDLSSYEQTLARQIAEVEQEIQELEARLEQEPDSSTSTALEGSRREARLTYANLLGSYLQIRATGGRSIYVEIVEPASNPARKVQPRIVFNTFVAAFAGLTLALGLVFLLDYLDDTLTHPENAEQTLQIPTLAAIPSVQARNAQEAVPFAAVRPMSPFAEAYRTLRTNVQFLSVDKAARTLLVASALGNEGKTTTVANLGIVMAQAGIRVLLVDTDLRHGTLNELFSLPGRPGLTDLLLADAAPNESCLFETTISNLYLLPSGPLPPTPSELLGSERMKKLIQNLCALTDILLFDSPPVLAVTDAAVLATRVDGVLLVVDSSRTPQDDSKKALHGLQAVGGKVLGTVLTRCRVEGAGYYYGRQDAKPRWLVDAGAPASTAASVIGQLKQALRSISVSRRGLSGPSSPDRYDGSL